MDNLALLLVSRTPDAAALIRALSAELAARYDFADDGSGKFRPEDVDGPGSGFLVGRLDGMAVACGAPRPLEGMACEIKQMFVMEEVRGRGLAGPLLAEIERLARESGYGVAGLETGVRQPEAIRLYERVGYHRIENFGSYHGNEQSLRFESLGMIAFCTGDSGTVPCRCGGTGCPSVCKPTDAWAYSRTDDDRWVSPPQIPNRLERRKRGALRQGYVVD